ncbi:MAG: DUF1569 domain-containing protein [Phycisphaerales bacterium]
MAVDTKSVTDRRSLTLNSLQDLRREVERIAASERSGKLRRSGNWSAGQSFHHLATWMGYSYTGPPGPKPPWLLRLMGPVIKRRFLTKGVPAGFRMRNVEGGTYGSEPRSLDEGTREILAAIERLGRERLPDRHALFGRMTPDEWIRLHLKHAELHLSFLHP